MGMFNWVLLRNRPICPHCGRKTHDRLVQSKDISICGRKLELTLDTIEAGEGVDGTVHTICPGCHEYWSGIIKDGKLI